jgi:hypothetical protein
VDVGSGWITVVDDLDVATVVEGVLDVVEGDVVDVVEEVLIVVDGAGEDDVDCAPAWA